MYVNEQGPLTSGAEMHRAFARVISGLSMWATWRPDDVRPTLARTFPGCGAGSDGSAFALDDQTAVLFGVID